MGRLDLGLGLGFDVGIDRRGNFVDGVNWRRLGILVWRVSRLLQRRHLRAIHFFQKLVELLLDARIGADLLRRGQKQLESAIKTLAGRFYIASLELVLPGLIFLFGSCNQIGDRVGLRRGWSGIGRNWCRLYRCDCNRNRRGSLCQRGRRSRGRRQHRHRVLGGLASCGCDEPCH